jgi:hypothetical protein
MPIRYGIVCSGCRKFHIISGDGKFSRAHFDRIRSEFKTTCVPPCSHTIYFRAEMLLPYIVPEEVSVMGDVTPTVPARAVDLLPLRHVPQGRRSLRTLRNEGLPCRSYRL